MKGEPMKRMITAFVLLVAVAMAVGCGRADNAQAAGADAIRNLDSRWNADYAAKDTETLLGYYADDAVLMGPGMAPAMGRESIRQTLRAMVTDPALTLKFRPARIEVAQSGEIAYSQGAYAMTMTDAKTRQVVRTTAATHQVPPSARGTGRGSWTLRPRKWLLATQFDHVPVFLTNHPARRSAQ